MADIDSKETCETCRFFDVNGNVVGSCHRFPDSVVKSKAHWCGEHQAKAIKITQADWDKANTITIVSEPAKTIKPVIQLQKEYTIEELEALKPKKRGRKAKSDEA